MSLLRPASASQINLGLTVLRVVAGFVFFMHGYLKVFKFGLAGLTGFFTQAGVPMPGITAPLNMTLEFLGGIALIIGLFVRPLAALFVIDMLGAILFVDMKHGFFMPTGMELTFLLCGAALALALAGGGSYSADAVIARRRGSPVA